MSWIQQAVAAFGETIGIADLALDAEHRLCLSVRHGGEIHIIHLANATPAEVLVVRTQPLGPDRLGRFRKALRLADFRSLGNYTVQTAVRQDDLVLAARIPERAFALHVLEDTLTQLTQMHQTISE